MNDDTMKYDFLRMERDKLLRLSDKYVLPDYPHADDTIRNEWLAYRQNLRDLPSTINIEDIDLMCMPKLSRQVNCVYYQDDINELGHECEDGLGECEDGLGECEDGLGEYVLNNDCSPYRTDSAVAMMRSISGNNNIGIN